MEMLKIRVIPILTFNGFSLVKTKQFNLPRTIGNPIQAARVYNSRNVDELVFIDIEATSQKRKINHVLVKKIIDECFMPITIGGGINSQEDIRDLLNIGADKVLIKTKAIEDVKFIKDSVNYFGGQCISIALDVVKKESGNYCLYHPKLKYDLNEFISNMNDCNVGEFVLNSVNEDGMMNGYDIELIEYISDKVDTPIIVAGGAGDLSHFKKLFKSGYSNAVAASSIFHFTQFTPQDVKMVLKEINIPVRI